LSSSPASIIRTIGHRKTPPIALVQGEAFVIRLAVSGGCFMSGMISFPGFSPVVCRLERIARLADSSRRGEPLSRPIGMRISAISAQYR
jgi:hypothetical protein